MPVPLTNFFDNERGIVTIAAGTQDTERGLLLGYKHERYPRMQIRPDGTIYTGDGTGWPTTPFTGGGGGAATLDDLTDVSTAGGLTGYVLTKKADGSYDLQSVPAGPEGPAGPQGPEGPQGPAGTPAPETKGYVNHGTVASTARPTGFASIEWWGSAEPLNMVTGDTWVKTA